MLSTILLALVLRPGSGLRMLNPNDGAVDAVVRCGGISRAVHVEEHDVVDLAPSAVCASPLVGDVEFFSLHTTEAAREGDIDMLNGTCNAQRVCSFPFKDTHGPGNVTVQIYYGGHCNMNPPPATVSFTVTP